MIFWFKRRRNLGGLILTKTILISLMVLRLNSCRVRLSRFGVTVAARGNVVMIVVARRALDAKFMVGGAVNAALANFSKALAVRAFKMM